MKSENIIKEINDEGQLKLIIIGIEDARRNIMERVKQREISLIFYLGAVSTIIGLAFNEKNLNERILLIIPFLSFGITLIVSFHNSMMNALSQYIVKELEPKLRDLKIEVPLWDNSISMSKVTEGASRFRVAGFMFLILFPPIFALILNVEYLNQWAVIILWASGVLSVLGSVLIFMKTVKNRWNFHKKLFAD